MSLSTSHKTAITTINQILNATNGVTIILDFDGTSTAALVDSLYAYEKKSRTLEINAVMLSEANKQLLFKIIRKVHNDGGLILSEPKSEVVEAIKGYSSKKSQDDQIFEFFNSILSKNDSFALRMSLFLRSEATAGKNIHTYKNDIRERFGERGANIANLCSAGYFDKDKELQSLYLSVPKPEFFSYYEMVVGAKARALFVHANMKQRDLEAEVADMCKKALQYRMDDFRIHGKGAANIAKIRRLADKVSPDDSFNIEKVWEDPKFQAIEFVIKVKR